jgi:hypothetical protein
VNVDKNIDDLICEINTSFIYLDQAKAIQCFDSLIRLILEKYYRDSFISQLLNLEFPEEMDTIDILKTMVEEGSPPRIVDDYINVFCAETKEFNKSVYIRHVLYYNYLVEHLMLPDSLKLDAKSFGYRVTHCIGCGRPLNNLDFPECHKCRRIICTRCGACYCKELYDSNDLTDMKPEEGISLNMQVFHTGYGEGFVQSVSKDTVDVYFERLRMTKKMLISSLKFKKRK